MGTFKQMLQAVVAAATARTTSTVTDNDLIQLYDTNNQPTIKITKSVLMDCVRASLGSLLNASGADQGTSGAKFPSINSAGVLGSMTAANLASVLGETIKDVLGSTSVDLNDVYNVGAYTIPTSSAWDVITNKPSGSLQAGVLFVKKGSSSGWRIQILVFQNNQTCIRHIFAGRPQYNTDWSNFTLTSA